MPGSPLPIDPLLPEIVRTVATHPVTLLEAEPGTGKTTRVPPALLEAKLGPVCVLEPRRIAARLAARRVAAELGQEVGATVGYRVRFEEVSSAATQLWYCTEGVLVRSLLSNRNLDARVVVLDEFHERHVETDVAFALLRELQRIRRDLHILIMSATLGGEQLQSQLPDVPLIKAPGKVFPLTIEYTPHSAAPLEERAAAAVGRALERTAGHVLVFLPGAAEIRKTLQASGGVARSHSAALFALHGDLPAAEQDRVLAPSAVRKVICSTNLAESSITIDGVTAVVDSGLARVRTHSHWSGLSRLHVQKISRSSAVQRSGRAARTAPGLAIRLYSEAEFVRFPEQLQPELMRSELSELVLLLAAHDWHLEKLRWLEPPPGEAVAAARELLERLGAMTQDGTASNFGRRMAELPVHPRLACFMLRAVEMGEREPAVELAAKLSEGRFRIDKEPATRAGSDLEIVLAGESASSARRLASLLKRITRRETVHQPDADALEKALLLAYPDRVARRRGETLLLSNGGSAGLDSTSRVQSEFLVAIEIDDRSATSTPLVRLASHIEPDWLLDFFPERVHSREEIIWNKQSECVEQVNSLIYDELVIDEYSGPARNRAAAASLLATKALEAGLARITDPEPVERFLRRVRFAAQHAGIDIPPDLLEAGLRDLAEGLTSFDELRAAAANGGLLALLQARLPMRMIDEIAPTHILLSSGRRAPIEYHENGKPPSVAARLQDFFGMQHTPTVARGAVALTVELLAPNRRPVQVTSDLASFWRNLYPQVRRELSRRYPKHAWPESPT